MLDADTDTYTFGGRGRGVQMHSKPLHFEVQGRAAKKKKTYLDTVTMMMSTLQRLCDKMMIRTSPSTTTQLLLAVIHQNTCIQSLDVSMK